MTARKPRTETGSLLADRRIRVHEVYRKIKEDLDYVREQLNGMLNPVEQEARATEDLRRRYVEDAAIATTLWPVQRLAVFNTLYPPVSKLEKKRD